MCKRIRRQPHFPYRLDGRVKRDGVSIIPGAATDLAVPVKEGRRVVNMFAKLRDECIFILCCLILDDKESPFIP